MKTLKFSKLASLVLFIIALALIASTLLGCNADSSAKASQAKYDSQAKPLKLVWSSIFYCRCGMYVLTAKIKNPNKKLGLQASQLTANLMDKNGKTLLVAGAYLNYIFPNQEKYLTFEADARQPLKNLDHYRINLAANGWQEMDPKNIPKLKVLSYTWRQKGERDGYVVGKIKNTSNRNYRALFVRAFLCDKDNNVEGVAFQPKLTLKAGQTAYFWARTTSLQKINPKPIDHVIMDADTYDASGKLDEFDFSCVGFSAENKGDSKEHAGHTCNISENP